MNTLKTILIGSVLALPLAMTSCNRNEDDTANLNSIMEETYAGGILGTTFNTSASAYEDPTPAVEYAGLVNEFKYGEYFFERTITQSNAPFNGLGPVYVRSSCISCHPGYGHGRRMNRYP